MSCLSSSPSMWTPNGCILTPCIKAWSMLCIQTASSVAESLLTPRWQQLSTDSTAFSSSNQSMENWSLSHVHLDRSRLAGSLTAQLSCVPMSLFGRRQPILGGAESRKKQLICPSERAVVLWNPANRVVPLFLLLPCHCQTGSHSRSVADSLRCRNRRCPFFCLQVSCTC